MSISSEISRISKNVADSLDAVAAKGVTIPSGSTSDDLPDLISQITSGGVIISDTTDSAGGTIRTITSSQSTLLVSKTVTQNGTYTPSSDNANGYSEVIVNVQGGGPSYTWETVWNGNVSCTDGWGESTYAGYPQLTEVIPANSVWRVTWDGDVYECVATWAGHPNGNPYAIGNYTYEDGGSGGTEFPFFVQMYWGTNWAIVGSYGDHTVKFEKRVESSGSVLVPKTITQNGTYDPADDDADGYSSVTVNVSGGAPNLQAKTNISPTTSSQTITADSGYDGLSSVQINAMPTGTVTAPSSISGSSAAVSTGSNTITLTKTVSVTPNVSQAGYVSSGTAGNSSVSLTASVITKAAATITPTKSTQTIASGTYLTGTQTIAAIPAAYQDVTSVTAAAGDVVSGKDIVNSSGTVVHGSLVIQHYYTGSSAPASSLGVNGDIYLKT